ncbi:MAG: V-type ATP synthase subunit D [Nitrospinae bacterium]|nr:V-type ATP synthase subunit D [Nitrospinota bacterium]
MSLRNKGRLELLRQKKELLLVSHGVKILSAKRDALAAEFADVSPLARALKSKLAESLVAAEKSLLISKSLAPAQSLSTSAKAAEREIKFVASIKNVWGVRIPSAEFPDTRRSPFNRGSAPGYRSTSVDETAGLYEKAVGTLMETAVAESNLLKVGAALKNAMRRVNALDTVLRPEIKKTIAQIKLKLGEMEREEVARLKRYKSLKRGV